MASPCPLADLFGEPRPITLAGETYMIAPLRVADLAALGAFAMRGRSDGPDPIAVAASLNEDAPKADRASAMQAAQDFANAPPPDVGTEGYREATASGEALAWFAYVALRRHNPGFGLAEASALVARLASGDLPGFARLYVRAFGTHPARRFALLIGGGGDETPPDWPAAIDRVASERHWTYEQVGEMTLPAFSNAARGGKAPEVEYTPRKGETTAGLRRRVKSLLGLD